MAYRKAIDAFEALEENQFARALESYFIQRFVDTCNIEFAHLAYVFTAEGLSDFRERHPNFEDEQCLVEIGSLKACFRSLATNYYSNEEYNQLFLPGLFDLYLQEADFGTGENLYCWWKQRFVDKISSPGINHGRPVSLKPLAEIALIVVTMPCTEAVCERTFSQMKQILNSLNHCMLPDTFVAIATIKLSTRFSMKYE